MERTSTNSLAWVFALFMGAGVLVLHVARRVHIFRALIAVLTLDALMLLLVSRIHPFQPQSLISGLAWALLLCVVATCLWVLVEIERHPLLSRAFGSEPGKITWDFSFFVHISVFVLLPILALVAVHFPEIGGPLFKSLQPLLRAPG